MNKVLSGLLVWVLTSQFLGSTTPVKTSVIDQKKVSGNEESRLVVFEVFMGG